MAEDSEPMTAVTTDPIRSLKQAADQGSDMCYANATSWRRIYYASRGSVIICAALASADALKALPLAFHSLQPFFALLVTVITGFDVWLKPGAKYRALYM